MIVWVVTVEEIDESFVIGVFTNLGYAAKEVIKQIENNHWILQSFPWETSWGYMCLCKTGFFQNDYSFNISLQRVTLNDLS